MQNTRQDIKLTGLHLALDVYPQTQWQLPAAHMLGSPPTRPPAYHDMTRPTCMSKNLLEELSKHGIFQNLFELIQMAMSVLRHMS